MDKHQVFAAWASSESIWSVWAKPVLFAHMPPSMTGRIDLNAPAPVAFAEGVETFVPPAAAERTALILDLAGADAVFMSIPVARAGYRPVPLYNAVPASAAGSSPGNEAVNVGPIMHALQALSGTLAKIEIPRDAPPAFLLDSRRAGGAAPLQPGQFDNRSISLPTDFPSAAFLAEHDIRAVLLVRESQLMPLEDVAHTLRRYQDARIPIYSRPLTSPGAPQPIQIPRPSWYRSTFHRLLSLLGFRRHRLGGFGGTLPIPSAG